jgi:Tfp pilus assembly protein FimT
MAILAALAALAAPSFNNLLNRQAISHQAWEVRRALELARSLAVAEQQVWKVCMADLNLQCVKQQGQRLLVFRDSNSDQQEITQ